MTISANAVIEVRQGGSDTNGGGFVTGASGTDWSQQNAAQYSKTDGVANGTTTFTSTTAAFGTDVVGNLIYIAGGTGTLTGNWYEITARASSTSITLDRSPGTSTGCTFNIGGALASPGQGSFILNSANQPGQIMYIKYSATPYTITSATANVSGGCISPGNNSGQFVVGYDTTRALYTPFQNRPTLQLGSGVSSANIAGGQNIVYSLQSVILDCNGQTSSRAAYQSGEFHYVKVMNFTLAGIKQNINSGVAFLCEATGAQTTGDAISVQHAIYCTAHDNVLTSTAWAAIVAGLSCVGCIAYNNTGGGFAGPSFQGLSSLYSNCTAYGNSSYGFSCWNTVGGTFVNCIAEGNGTYGFHCNSGKTSLVNCAAYNNTSGRKTASSGFYIDATPINGSGSFFVNAAGGNFALNNTAGAGASVRAVSLPATQFNELTSTLNYLDLGAVQHQDAGGSSGPIAQLKQFGRGAPY